MTDGTSEPTLFFDYSCPFTNLVQLWLDGADAKVNFRPFSLAQSHRPDGAPPVWADPLDQLDPTILALAGHDLVRARGGDLDDYRRRMFAFWHGDEEPTVDGLWRLVETHAGGPVPETDLAAAVQAVAASHQRAVAAGVFGSPTLLFGEGGGFFVKLADLPPDRAAAADLWQRVRALETDFPELLELKRPTPR